jgi:polysaccharide pyruvyl transferase WcaK-like protein
MVDACHGARGKEFDKAARSCSAWVYGPGTVMGSKIQPSAVAMLEHKKPCIVWGVGSSKINKGSDGHRLIKSAAFVTARDTVSLERIQEWRPDAVLVPDPMYIFCGKSNQNNESRLNGVTISWSLFRDEQEDVQKALAKSITETMDKMGGKWVGIPASWNNKGVTRDNDIDVMSSLFPGLRVITPKDFKHVTSLLSRMDTYLTSRLHTGVVAAGFGAKIAMFGGSKLSWMSDQMGLPCYAGKYKDITHELIMDSLSRFSDDKRAEFVLGSKNPAIMRNALISAGIKV